MGLCDNVPSSNWFVCWCSPRHRSSVNCLTFTNACTMADPNFQRLHRLSEGVRYLPMSMVVHRHRVSLMGYRYYKQQGMTRKYIWVQLESQLYRLKPHAGVHGPQPMTLPSGPAPLLALRAHYARSPTPVRFLEIYSLPSHHEECNSNFLDILTMTWKDSNTFLLATFSKFWRAN
jgi:hypothetical protein